jgi:hypothetical protein
MTTDAKPQPPIGYGDLGANEYRKHFGRWGSPGRSYCGLDMDQLVMPVDLTEQSTIVDCEVCVAGEAEDVARQVHPDNEQQPNR